MLSEMYEAINAVALFDVASDLLYVLCVTQCYATVDDGLYRIGYHFLFEKMINLFFILTI